MSFANSIFLLTGAAFILLLAAFYLIAAARRKKSLENFADKKLLQEISLSLDNKKRNLKIAMIVTVVFLCFVSLARPQWGFEWKDIKNRGVDILFAIDASKSMLAEDIKPNRLKRVKLEVEDFVKGLAGDRVGIVTFSGNAFLQCPLTSDYDGFLINLQSVDTNTLPKEGTSISAAIDECIDAYKRNGRRNKIVILITDGEDHEGKVVEAAKNAQRDGIKIFCIGIGTKEGSTIPVTDKNNKQSYLRDISGAVVKTKLDDALLKKIAFITGASYSHAAEYNFGLEQLYKDRLSKIQKEAAEVKMEKVKKDRFGLFLFIALIILVLEPFISERRSADEHR